MFFYIIVAAGRFDLGNLRHQGWLFDMGTGMGSHQVWYKFYSYFGACNFIGSFDAIAKVFEFVAGIDINLVRFGPLWSTLPTQFALYVSHPDRNDVVLNDVIGCFLIFYILP